MMKKTKAVLRTFWKSIAAPGKFTKGWSPAERKRYCVLVFLVRFCALGLPLWVLAWSGWESYRLEALVAWLAAAVLRLAGYGASFVPRVSGELLLPGIVLAGKTTGVVWDCVEWKAVLAFLALVFAVPEVGWREKKKAFWFVPVIFAANVLRIATVVAVGYGWPSLFGLVHAVLWQVGMVVVVIGGWIWWFGGFGKKQR